MSEWPHVPTANAGKLFTESHLTKDLTDHQLSVSLRVSPEAVKAIRSGQPHWEFTSELPRTRNAYMLLAKTYGIDPNKLAARLRASVNVLTRHRSGRFKTIDQKADDYRGLRSKHVVVKPKQ